MPPASRLATLYESQGDFEKAGMLMRDFMADRPMQSAPLEWLELYARILRDTGQDPSTLQEVGGWIARRRR